MLQMNNVHGNYDPMELDDIRAFVTVADSGSVSRAATELFLTQPAVTRRLQRLETSLGTDLWIDGGDRLHLHKPAKPCSSNVDACSTPFRSFGL